MIDTRGLKAKAVNAPDPLKTLILSLPDQIDEKELVAKFDIFLEILEGKTK
ncbi:MAG: hypothetical protein QXU98_03995 [Candidatus Parvarchaeota archaeon]